uniref:Kelch-like protein 12 n=1 Tax=Phallusia mammillata TaxID=59560 RepID=A0A6F9DGG0_9ASCI|nr:kelch-like protein 12 [Phallusia mammillata]
MCKTALLNLVSADNCLKFRACAQRYNLDEVFVKTNQEITSSFAEVVRQDDFVQLDIDNMSAVIKLKDKTCGEALFTGIVQWVNHNPLQREELFVNLFSQMEFSSMSKDFLVHVSKENLVRNSSVCLSLLVDETLKLAQSPFTGKILIVGGNESPNDCVVYDVITRQPTHLPNLNIGRSGTAAVKVGSKVYVVGGFAAVDEDGYGDSDSNDNEDHDSDDTDEEGGQSDDEGGLSNDVGGHGDDEVDLSDDEDDLSDDEGGNEHQSCEILDLNEPTEWKVLPDMSKHRLNCGAGFIADHIYLTGGQNQNATTLSSCEKFDIHNKMWTKIKNMLHAREEHGTVVCNESLYCLGGYDDETVVLSSCERYDVRSDVWNEIAPLSEPRGGLTCVVLDGNIYAIGGFKNLKTVERLNPRLGTWENIAPLQHDHGQLSACVIGNKIFVIGGKTVEVYDPTLNVWATAFEIEKPVSGAAVVAI